MSGTYTFLFFVLALLLAMFTAYLVCRYKGGGHHTPQPVLAALEDEYSASAIVTTSINVNIREEFLRLAPLPNVIAGGGSFSANPT